MSTLSKLINLVQQPWLFRTVAVWAVVWVLLNLTCLVFGALGLYLVGEKKKKTPCWPAFLPGGQVWYTLQLCEKPRLAKRAVVLIWWIPALLVCAAAAVIWAAEFYLIGQGGVLLLLVLAVVFMLPVLGMYILLHALEFRVLFPRVENKAVRSLAVVGAVLGIPLHRIVLFFERDRCFK